MYYMRHRSPFRCALLPGRMCVCARRRPNAFDGIDGNARRHNEYFQQSSYRPEIGLCGRLLCSIVDFMRCFFLSVFLDATSARWFSALFVRYVRIQTRSFGPVVCYSDRTWPRTNVIAVHNDSLTLCVCVPIEPVGHISHSRFCSLVVLRRFFCFARPSIHVCTLHGRFHFQSYKETKRAGR